MGKFNELTKSMLIEEIVLPESKRDSCDVLAICANVEYTSRLEEVAAWMCGRCSFVSFPLGGFSIPRRVTWNQPIVLEHSDDV